MPLQKEIKTQVIQEYQKHETDTGSTQVQISILTTRIKQLTEHLKINKHDESSRRGLLIMVGRRRRLMNYLRRKDYMKYLDLVQKLQLRKLKIGQKNRIDGVFHLFCFLTISDISYVRYTNRFPLVGWALKMLQECPLTIFSS